MSEQDVWKEFREVLNQVMKDKAVRKHLGQNGEKIPYRTIFRWATGETQIPQRRQLLSLLEVLQQPFPQFHEQLITAIKKALSDFRIPLIDLSRNQIGGLPAEFLTRILETHVSTHPDLHFMTICRQVFFQVQAYLPDDGVELSVVSCTPPSSSKHPVQSLREELTLRSDQLQFPLGSPTSHLLRFLGMESLIGYCVGFHQAAYAPDLSKEELFPLPGHPSGSAVVFPIQRGGMIAGCFLVVSPHRSFFSETRQYVLQLYAYALALAYETDRFYPYDHIQLSFLPNEQIQLPLISKFLERVKRMFTTHPRLSPRDAELQVWQQIERELLEEMKALKNQERKSFYAATDKSPEG